VSIGRRRRVLPAVGGALLLAGCPAPPRGDTTTDVDRARADTLRAEPILSGAVRPPRVTTGTVLGGTQGWTRSEALATVESWGPVADDPATLPAGGTCVERPGVADQPERDGTARELAPLSRSG
jgi:hypothetical protein